MPVEVEQHELVAVGRQPAEERVDHGRRRHGGIGHGLEREDAGQALDAGAGLVGVEQVLDAPRQAIDLVGRMQGERDVFVRIVLQADIDPCQPSEPRQRRKGGAPARQHGQRRDADGRRQQHEAARLRKVLAVHPRKRVLDGQRRAGGVAEHQQWPAGADLGGKMSCGDAHGRRPIAPVGAEQPEGAVPWPGRRSTTTQ